jgi:hypothetical protein
MDKLAKQYWEATKNTNLPPQQIISDHEWSIWQHLQNMGENPDSALHVSSSLINTKAITD